MRHRSTLVAWLVLAALAAVGILATNGLPSSQHDWIVLAVSVVIGATVGLFLGFVWTTIYILTSSRRENGVLGVHTYTVKDEGLLEVTEANETLTRWGGASDLRRTPDTIYIQVAPALFHVIPRRAFASSSEFDSFWIAIQKLKRSDT